MRLPKSELKRHKRATRRGPGKWYVLFVALVTLGTLAASTAVGLFIGFINSLPPIEQLENYDPPQVSFVTDRGLREIGRFSSERRQVVPIDEIPRHLRRGVLAIEDTRFHDHFGIDLRSALGSLRANIRAGGIVRGASTITMQLPRNLLSEVSRQKTWERKIKEIILAFQIERRYSKDQILEFYLNQNYMGQRAYGVHEAAFTYFSKPLDELTLAECAMLAGLFQAPSIHNPVDNLRRATERRNDVLSRMRDLGWIESEIEYQNAVRSEIVVVRGRRPSNVTQSDHPYFVDALRRNLTGDYRIPAEDIRSKGWTIRSTVDPEYQRIAGEKLREGLAGVEARWVEKKGERFRAEAERYPGAPRAGQRRLVTITSVEPDSVGVRIDGYRGRVPLPAVLPYFDPSIVLRAGNRLDVRLTQVDHNRETLTAELADTKHVQGSVVILDARTAQVLALVGGADFHDSDNDGQYNRAIQGGRPAGSTVKPFFYAAALAAGHGPHDQIVDERIFYPDGFGGEYRPRNYENTFFGPTTLIEGIEHSRNIVTIRLFEALGIRRALAQVNRFDPSPGKTRWARKFRGGGLPVCLGSIDMTPLELAAAYVPFVNHGIGRRPEFFTSIKDKDGRTIHRPRRGETIVMDEIAAAQIIYMTRQVVLSGSGERHVGSSFPEGDYPQIAGKTGTTDNSTDAWFIGYTPDLIMVVHVGFDNPLSLGPEMSGGRVAAPIWVDIFREIHATRDDWQMTFDLPTGAERVDICGHTGKRVSTICLRYHPEEIYRGVPYRIGAAPAETCNDIPREPLIERFKAPAVVIPPAGP